MQNEKLNSIFQKLWLFGVRTVTLLFFGAMIIFVLLIPVMLWNATQNSLLTLFWAIMALPLSGILGHICGDIMCELQCNNAKGECDANE